MSKIVRNIPDGLEASYADIKLDTISDLVNLTGTPPDIVLVSGYHTKGDGSYGGHIFEWDPNSTETHNGGTIIELGATFPTDWSDQTQLDAWLNYSGGTTGRYKLRHSERVYPEFWGAKGYDGTYKYGNWESSTESMQAAINEAGSKQLILQLTRHYLITDEILVDKKIAIIGTGKPNADQLELGSWLVFDIKDPLKCGIRFSNTVVYDGYEQTLRNFGLLSFNKNTDGTEMDDASRPHNQHGLIFEKNFGYAMENIELIGFTGYAEFYSNSAYGQSLFKRNITYRDVGGAIGQDVNSLIVSTCKIVDINFEWYINQASPQQYLFDFRGWRECSIDSMILEGSSMPSAMIPMAFSSNAYMDIKNIHRELNPHPDKDIVIEQANYGGHNGIYEFKNIGDMKIESTMDFGVVNIINASEWYGKIDTDYTSPTGVTIFKIHTPADNEWNMLPTNADSFIGLTSKIYAEINNVSILSEWDVTKGLPRYLQEFKNGVTSIYAHTYHLDKYEVVNDTEMGRVAKLTSTDAGSIPEFHLNITPNNINKNNIFAVSALVKLETPDADGYLDMYNTSASGNHTSIRDATVNNAWVWVHHVFQKPNSTDTISTFVRSINITSPSVLYVAKAHITIGGVKANSNIVNLEQTIDGVGESAPSSGEYIVGDRLTKKDKSLSFICTASGNPGTWN